MKTTLLAVSTLALICACSRQDGGSAKTCGDVEVTITLSGSTTSCKARVDKDSACVGIDKTIRWTVDNRCGGPLEGQQGRPALAVTNLKSKADNRPAGWMNACNARLARVEAGAPAAQAQSQGNRMECRVPPGTAEGFYKYDLEGTIERLDPDIEIRRSN